MGRALTLAVVIVLTACGGVTRVSSPEIDSSIDTGDVLDAVDAVAEVDAMPEARPTACSPDFQKAADEGRHWSCCGGLTCEGECIESSSGTKVCDCGGIAGGCGGLMWCCDKAAGDAKVLTCGFCRRPSS